VDRSCAVAEVMPALVAAAALEAITALMKRRRESLGFTALVPALLVVINILVDDRRRQNRKACELDLPGFRPPIYY
jgi:hypothetical protein